MPAQRGHREATNFDGLGACDMKGSLAVMLALAVDARRDPSKSPGSSTRARRSRERVGPAGDARAAPGTRSTGTWRSSAEPTAGVVEAGCQGTLRVECDPRGTRAPTRRDPTPGRTPSIAWARVSSESRRYDPRTCRDRRRALHEQLQAVAVEGGVAANVVPDRARAHVQPPGGPRPHEEEAIAWLAALSRRPPGRRRRVRRARLGA